MSTENSNQPISETQRKQAVADRLALGRETAARNRALLAAQEDELRAQGVEPDVSRRASEGSTVNSPVTAIRAFCLDCTCGSSKEVELCTAPKCPLWRYRFGKRPETAEAKGRIIDPAKFVAVRG